CGLRPLVLQGEVSPCEPLWPASQLILVKKNRLSQRIVRHVLCHDPCPESSGHGYRLFLPAGWPEWAEKTVAATPAWLYWARYARKTKNQKPKTKNQKPKTKN